MAHTDDICSCCLANNDPIHTINLKCGHRFHHNCLDKWIKSKPDATCPMCRSEIRDENPAPNYAFAVEASGECVINWNFKSERAARDLLLYVHEHFDEISFVYETMEKTDMVIDTGRMQWTIPRNPTLKIRSELANLMQGAHILDIFNS